MKLRKPVLSLIITLVMTITIFLNVFTNFIPDLVLWFIIGYLIFIVCKFDKYERKTVIIDNNSPKIDTCNLI